MKTLKITLLGILSIFIMGYLAFLFILPYSIDLNKYSPQITKTIEDCTGIQTKLKGLRVKTAWNLSAGAIIERADLKYPAGKKFAQINGLKIRLSLIPLIWRNIVIDRLDAEKILLNLEVNKDGDFLLKSFLSKKSPKNNDFNFSTNMPDITAKKYRISFIKGQNIYSLKGDNLKISDFILNEKIKIKSTGEAVLNGRKQISYKLAINSKVFPENKKQKTDIIKIFEDLYKYNINANIDTDLAIKNKKNNVDINGKISFDKVSFALGNNIFPQSSLKLAFKGDRAKINSSLKTNKNSKVIISGFFKTGKNKSVDLRVISNEIDINDIILITKTMSKPFGIKDLQNINANGLLKANFNIKSDFKKVESDGYLKIKNANLTHKLYKIALSSINADVDFSQNAIQIKKAKANLNGEPVTIIGNIDKNAIADISVLADNLQLKGILLATGQAKILKENDILSGKVNIKAALKGKLNNASPKISASIDNAIIKNKKTKTQIKFKKAIINSNKDKENKGRATVTNIYIYPASLAIISAPKINLIFDEKNLCLEKTSLYINNIKTALEGKISNLNTTPQFNPLRISIPNQISTSIKDYQGSNIVMKGGILITGNIDNPQIQGEINIPSINIPTISTTLKNTTLQFNKNIKINCPHIKIANSLAAFSAQINNDFSNGIIAKNVDFSADNIDLNYLIPIFKNLNGNSNLNLTILNGKNSIKKFRAGGVTSANITSGVSLKNNVLYLDDLLGEAYFGKIGGNLYYDLKHRKTNLELQGRGLSANQALIGLTGRDDDIKGQLDFDGNVSMFGFSKSELLRNLNGNIKFIISNGKMGILGKFEHLLYAQNVLSNNVFRATLNLVAKAVTVKNTGVYKYMKGEINFSNGWANIAWIKTSGPSMSLYINGRYYMPDNTANLTMLGRISDDVVRILGPIGEFSMDKAISSIPKIGEITSYFINQFTTNPNYENTSMIPYLTPRTEFPTKEFKVVIDGEVHKQSSVKSFKWISAPKAAINQPQNVQQQKPAYTVPDFVNKLPDFKN